MRALLFICLALAGCTRPAEAPAPGGGAATGPQSLVLAVFEFVNTSAARTDALDVPGGGAALTVDLGVALSIGDLGYALTDPDGDERWAGTTDAPDTLMTWRTEAPDAGVWTMTLRPISATGAASVSGRTE